MYSNHRVCKQRLDESSQWTCNRKSPRMNSKWERSPHMNIPGNIPHGPAYHRDVEYWGPPGICPLDQLPAPVAWTSYCRCSPLSAITLSALLNFGPVLFTYRNGHWGQTHLLHGIKITKRRWLSWLPWSFSPHSPLPFPSHLSWSLIMSCLVVFDFWGFK